MKGRISIWRFVFEFGWYSADEWVLFDVSLFGILSRDFVSIFNVSILKFSLGLYYETYIEVDEDWGDDDGDDDEDLGDEDDEWMNAQLGRIIKKAK